MQEEKHIIQAITKVELEGFKSIKNLKVNFKRGLNIIIGKNASGKSNFFQGLMALTGRDSTGYWNPLSLEGFKDIEAGAIFLCDEEENIINYHCKKMPPERAMLELRKERGPMEYPSIHDQVVRMNSKVVYDSKINQGFLKIANSDGQEVKVMRENAFHDVLRMTLNQSYMTPWVVSFNVPNGAIFLDEKASFTFHENRFSYTPGNTAFEYMVRLLDDLLIFNRQNGEFENLGEPALKEYIQSQLKLDSKILAELKKNSNIGDVRLAPKFAVSIDETGKVDVENLYFEFKLDERWFPWNALSDGTKRLFYLITEMSWLEHGIFLIEEPELGIHPHQFAKVMDFLKEQSETKQIIISTHSPQALDILSSEELDRIIICEYKKEEGTIMRHLSSDEKEKATDYIEEIGFLRDYWIMSDLED